MCIERLELVFPYLVDETELELSDNTSISFFSYSFCFGYVCNVCSSIFGIDSICVDSEMHLLLEMFGTRNSKRPVPTFCAVPSG